MKHWLTPEVVTDRMSRLDEIIGILTATMTTLKRKEQGTNHKGMVREESVEYNAPPLDPRPTSLSS